MFETSKGNPRGRLPLIQIATISEQRQIASAGEPGHVPSHPKQSTRIKGAQPMTSNGSPQARRFGGNRLEQ